MACHAEAWPAASVIPTHTRHVSTQPAIFPLARVFFLLDFPWAERLFVAWVIYCPHPSAVVLPFLTVLYVYNSYHSFLRHNRCCASFKGENITAANCYQFFYNGSTVVEGGKRRCLYSSPKLWFVEEDIVKADTLYSIISIINSIIGKYCSVAFICMFVLRTLSTDSEVRATLHNIINRTTGKYCSTLTMGFIQPDSKKLKPPGTV